MTLLAGNHGVRFAPSPTGIFHVGNLRTAWISSQLARALSETWIVRVEDIDVARVRADSWPSQLSDLSELGLNIDILQTQSEHQPLHLELFERARREGKIYPCDCSRKQVLAELERIASAPHAAESEYTGHCRNRTEAISSFHPRETLAWRWRSSDPIGRHDAIVARTAPDGSIFTPGYNWACAIDDATGGFHVLVRAWDLQSVDEVQREIRNWILNGFDEPVVFHTSLVTQNDGRRLEKRTLGVTLSELHARGISTENLIENFKTSFNLEAAIQKIRQHRRPVGEHDRSIALSQLSI